MPQAILIAGTEFQHPNKERFLAPLLTFKTFLENTGVNVIALLDANDFQNEQSVIAQLYELMNLCEEANATPQLIAYYGHGGLDGWYLQSAMVVPYQAIANLMAKDTCDPRSILIINDCCYAGNLVTYLKKADVSPERVGVIPAAYEEYGDDWPLGSVINRIILSWGRGIAWDAPAFPQTNKVTEIRIFDFGFGAKPKTRRQCATCRDTRQMHLFPIKELPHILIVDPRTKKFTGSSRHFFETKLVSKRWGVNLDVHFLGQNQFYLSD